MMVIDDWLAIASNLKGECEKIRGGRISDRTWRDWERLCGAIYNNGQRFSSRSYTLEQTQLLLCLAWLRRHNSREKVTYKSVRDFWSANQFKVEEAYDQYCKNPQPTKKVDEPSLFLLAQVKQCCDQIACTNLSRECWSKWKQHLGIKKNSRYTEEYNAALLVFMACWRQDHPTTAFPSVRRLLIMMNDYSRSNMTLETASSGQMQHKWEMQGCLGKDLPKYLAANGYKVALSTLYKWGDFHKKSHYSIAELHEWKRLAQEKKYGSA